MSPIDTPSDGAVSVEAEPVEPLVEGQVGLCTQVILPEFGVYVVLPASTAEEAASPRGYLAVWRDAITKELFIYARPLYDGFDLGQSVVNLNRDRTVEVEALTSKSELLLGGVADARDAIEDDTRWQPLTHAMLWRLMGTDRIPSEEGLAELDAVAIECNPPPAGNDPSAPNCDVTPKTPLELENAIVVAVCGCNGPGCCGNNCSCNWCECLNCADTNICTADGCAGGDCYHHVISCDDNKPCTTDYCVPSIGCRHDPIYGSCNDNNACTVGDVCNTGGGYPNNCPTLPFGNCCGTPRNCTPDNDPCTVDCNSGSGCNAPTTGNYCGDDNDPCTWDYCYLGDCHVPQWANGQACPSDNNNCTLDYCQNGACIHPAGNNGASCVSDGNACTQDICSAGQCTHPPRCAGQSCCLSTGLCISPFDTCCGEGSCPSGSFCCPSGELCCPYGATCCGDTCCLAGEQCCGSCCGETCNDCLSTGTMVHDFASISLDPQTPCLGDTLTCTYQGGVFDQGMVWKMSNCATVWVPNLNTSELTYYFAITRPDGTVANGMGLTGGTVADLPGMYTCTFTVSAIRDCPPPPAVVEPVGVTVTPLLISTSVIDQDDPENDWWGQLGENEPFYGGSEPSTADNVKISIIPPPGVIEDIVWSVEGDGGGTYNPPPSGPEATVWELGDVLNPVPGPIKFKVTVYSADGVTKYCAEFNSVVGVRTDDVIVIGWIDRENVFLDTVNVQQELLTLLPPTGPPVGLSASKFMLQVANGDIDPLGIPLDAAAHDANRRYALTWMFKYATNPDPRSVTGPLDFRDSTDAHIDVNKIGSFLSTSTNYKLFQRFQVRFTAEGSSFVGSPSVVRSLFAIGWTVDPTGALGLLPGQPGPNDGKLGETNYSVWQVNEGSPDANAVLAFNTLMGNAVPSNPTFWESIGSKIRFTADGGAAPTVSVQVYPTFFEYHNGRFVGRYDQLPDPQGAFTTNPYPFGPVPCLSISYPHLQGRCGDAHSIEDPGARLPPFLP